MSFQTLKWKWLKPCVIKVILQFVFFTDNEFFQCCLVQKVH
jgi:hypothetical protein